MTTYNIYRRNSVSDTPIAIATGLTSKNYTDTAVIEGNTYLYSVGVIIDGQELISDEVEVLAGPTPIVTDPLWSNVELLIFADAASFPSTTLIDSSSRARTVYKAGSTQIIASEHLYDHGAILTDSSNTQYFGFNSSLGIGTGDFTKEAFVKIASDAVTNPFDAFIFDLNSIRLKVLNNDSTYKTFQVKLGTGTTYNLTSLATSAKDRWCHFCLMRKNGVIYAFIDGVLMASFANTYNLTSTTFFSGGAVSGRAIKAYYNCCRVTKAARYSETGFTVPTEKFPTL